VKRLLNPKDSRLKQRKEKKKKLNRRKMLLKKSLIDGKNVID
jgi:hypothetical protein